MPYISPSTYKAPLLLKNHHVQTIYRPLYHKVEGVNYKRERFNTPDGDFLDLDWSKQGNKKLIIACHGLEGSTESTYIKSLCKYANSKKWDFLGINFRGCSGEPNLKLRTYHSGETSDLDTVISYASSLNVYQQIAIVGFSLGGNVVLKYAGENGKNIPSNIIAAVGVSVPCHLETSSYALSKWQNKLYMGDFMKSLKEKVKLKWDLLDDVVDKEAVMASVNFNDFDQHYTAPVFGFKDAIDYWTQSSSLQFLPNVAIPTLLLNAKDDSFLSDLCYPVELAKKSNLFHFEAPKNGGHVAFVSFKLNGFNWIETRILEFLSTLQNS